MKEVEKFAHFFSEIGNLCFQIYMVERPKNIFDLTTEENQFLNPQYLETIKARHPKAIRGFFVAMKQSGEGVQFFLTETYGVIVEYINDNHGETIEKTVEHISVAQARKDLPSYINYLTRRWNPLIE